MDDLKLGFLNYCAFDNGTALRGAMLVTDSCVKPLEFRITSCIRPTKFQKALYGKILNDYILIDLVTLPILASLSSKPSIIVVRNPIFLAANQKQQTAILRLYQKGETAFTRNGCTHPLNNNNQTVPIYIETTENMREKFNTYSPALEQISNQFNLLEPFERISMASKQVHEQGVGERG